MQTQIGKYELKRALGAGTCGIVYRALDTFEGREVALKVFDSAVLRDPRLGELTRVQFMNEAALAGRLSHPHIAAIYEAVMQDDAGYVAMEYVPGGSLVRFVRPEALLPVNDVIQIGFKSCSALDYAFRMGVIHRDIKPANLLVDHGTHIKVADFGAALLRTEETPRQMIVGSPSYMSPEQHAGRELTHHSDMYAMGVVLFELLTGGRPFTAASKEDLVRKVTTEPPQAPSALRPDVPARLEEIVLRMLSKRPEDRYPTWAELALDLAQVGKLSVYQREIADSEKFGVLRKSDLFGRLDDAHLWELVHSGRWSRLPPRSTILREDEAGRSMFLLGSGDLKVTKRGRLLNVLKGGECFGEMAFILDSESLREATVEAMTEVLIAEFEPAVLSRMSEGCRLEIAHRMLRTLAERLAMADVRISQSV
jgi:serine/threonine protein kinase